jgi:uncharacterized protein (TIGR02246 family)
MKTFAATCSLLLACACASQPSADFQAGDAEKAIRKADSDFVMAARSGDTTAIVNTYAPDAIVLASNTPMVHGREAIRSFWTGFLGQFASVDFSLTPDDVQQSGDLAVETGRYRANLTPKNATTPVNDEGKYVVVWRKIGGQWKMVRDMFSSDLAPAH